MELTVERYGFNRSDDRLERLVAIEYIDGHPNSVMTLSDWAHDGKSGTSASYYNFDYCKRDNALYFHLSGIGSTRPFHIGPFVHPEKVPGEIWLSGEVDLATYDEGPIDDRQLLAMGYKKIKTPKDLDYGWPESNNPFTVGIEDETVYCKVCDDQLPESNECQHVEWCDDCGGHFYVADRVLLESFNNHKCEHVDDEEDDD